MGLVISPSKVNLECDIEEENLQSDDVVREKSIQVEIPYIVALNAKSGNKCRHDKTYVG